MKYVVQWGILSVIAFFIMAKPGIVFGAWPEDPEVNVPICTASGTQEHPRITTDGATGAIIVWQDISSPSSDIYAQRIDARGEIRWAKDGVAICLEKGNQWFPNLVSDGSGGAIIAWWDNRNGDMETDIYAQRINSDGEIQWQPGGIPICTASGVQQELDITSDGSGGAIFAWHDYRADSGPDIYAQRINLKGEIQWKRDGTAVSVQPWEQSHPSLVNDGTGGAIIAWHDGRNGNCDIYVQRLNARGQPLWQEHGIPICKAPGHQWYPAIAADKSGGAIITWMDYRGGEVSDIYAQHVNTEGKTLWQADGMTICAARGDQYDYSIISDGSGGAFIVWRDQRTGEWDIYAQKLDTSGNIKWTENGLPVCTEPKDQYNPNLCSDGADGIIIAWWDERNGSADIYAQLIDTSGNFLWAKSGAAICIITGGQQDPYPVNSGIGSAIIIWWDKRRVDADIYAQRVFSDL